MSFTVYSDDQNFTLSGGLPLVTLTAASAITNTTAINGTVNPRGTSTTYYFAWGSTGGSLTNQTSTQSAGSGSSAQSVSANLTGLTAGQSVFYKLVAINTYGASTSAEGSFATIGGTNSGPFKYQPLPANTKLASPNCLWYTPLPSTPTRNWRLGYYQGRSSFTAWYGYPVYTANYHAQYTEAGLKSALQGQMSTYGGWLNYSHYSAKIYNVPANLPMQHLQIYQTGAYQTWPSALNVAFANTPLPLQELTPSGTLVNTQPATGADGALSVYSASLDTLWQTNYDSDVPQQSDFPYGPFWGGVFYNLSQTMGVVPLNEVIPGYGSASPRNPDAWGSSASGMIVECGVLKWGDWITNHAFNHAIYFQTVSANPIHTYPAYKGDGQAQGNNHIPHGTMFRFDPTIDLSPTDSYGSCSRFGLTPFAAAMARAIQTYG